MGKIDFSLVFAALSFPSLERGNEGDPIRTVLPRGKSTFIECHSISLSLHFSRLAFRFYSESNLSFYLKYLFNMVNMMVLHWTVHFFNIRLNFFALRMFIEKKSNGDRSSHTGTILVVNQLSKIKQLFLLTSH